MIYTRVKEELKSLKKLVEEIEKRKLLPQKKLVPRYKLDKTKTSKKKDSNPNYSKLKKIREKIHEEYQSKVESLR